jgi:hypothetical protein
MIEKITVVNKIEILEDGTIQYRLADRFIEDGRVAAEKTHRKVLTPADTVDQNEDQQVKDVSVLIHTSEVIEKYIDKKIKALQESGIKGMESEIERLQAIKAENKIDKGDQQ